MPVCLNDTLVSNPLCIRTMADVVINHGFLFMFSNGLEKCFSNLFDLRSKILPESRKSVLIKANCILYVNILTT